MLLDELGIGMTQFNWCSHVRATSHIGSGGRSILVEFAQYNLIGQLVMNTNDIC